MSIDPQTYERYRVADLHARTQGKALPEVLDDRRLLLTQDREHQIRVDVMEAMQKRLEQKTIGDLMRVFNADYLMHGASPDQVYKLVLQWVDTFVAAVKTKTLE